MVRRQCRQHRWGEFWHLLPNPSPYTTFHSTQNRSFRRNSASQSPGLVCKKTKLNTTKAHIHHSKEMYYITKYVVHYKINKKKTKARFSWLLAYPAWKRRGYILISALTNSSPYLLRHLPTYLQPRTHTEPLHGISKTYVTRQNAHISCSKHWPESELRVLLWSANPSTTRMTTM